jgi:hypothetical protein
MRRLLEDGLANEKKAKQSLEGRMTRLEYQLEAFSKRLEPTIAGGQAKYETQASQQEQKEGHLALTEEERRQREQEEGGRS